MLEQFTPRERTEGDSYKPSEHIGAVLIVRVLETKFIESTIHKPDGGPAVICDVHDLRANETFRDVLWMNGAVVDELKGWLGKTIVVKFAWAQPSKAGGQQYITVLPADAGEMSMAQTRMLQGDPFAVQLQTTAPPNQGYSPGGNYGQPQYQQQAQYPPQRQQAPPPPQDPWGNGDTIPGSQPPF
jgi:hypothetical protein